MGIFVGWAVRGWWLFFVGIAVTILSAAIPWSDRALRLAVLSLGLAIILAQLVMIHRAARAGRSARPPDSN